MASVNEEIENQPNTSFEALTDAELQETWDTTSNFKERDRILAELQRRNLFPSAALGRWEYETGAYPDVRDPEFLQKLLAKREFAESFQTTWKPREDPCEEDTPFEITPIQRFVANFMSPKTPYMSALLFHGVGVGKTCAAVQIIEAWLEIYPRNEILLIAPPTIQQGFFRNIFDISKIKLGDGQEPNTASQCTGDTYMRLTNTLYERDLTKIERAVNRLIRKRYKVFGYISFANYVRDILKGIPASVPEELKNQLKKKKLRDHFSGKLLIVDEAHNLRDIIDESDIEETTYAGGKAEKGDAAGGKILTPYLRDVLQYSEGMKFCALTATPMYNSYKEIIFMLNLLLLNDKKATITEADIFDKEGNITESGTKLLTYIAQRYISFMRGENPISFPIRLFPQNAPILSSYPATNPRGTDIPDDEKSYYEHLPIVPIILSGDVLKASLAFMNALPPGKGLNPITLEKLVHAGNFIVPATDATAGDTIEAYKERTDVNGISQIFTKETSGGEVRYRAKQEGGAKWLGITELGKYSPKFEFLINRIRTAEGCIFAYTRFVGAGALPLALALEANGYTPHGRKTGLLANGIQTPGGKQCALCPRREREHGNATHAFSPAYYGILTGDVAITPRKEQIIDAQRAFSNADGSKMKIIIGSQIAGEGVDLRFIRETHVIDSWFHLNRTEQILGRAIRFLSHCALPKEKRNTTVYLYAAQLPLTLEMPNTNSEASLQSSNTDVSSESNNTEASSESDTEASLQSSNVDESLQSSNNESKLETETEPEPETEPENNTTSPLQSGGARYSRETADLFSYRSGFKKAVLVGRVTRILKQGALDCNLNKDAIIIRGQSPITEIDAQGKVRDDVNINDMPFTAVCDWIETCDYECKPKINIKELTIDDSTYDEFSARWRVNKLKERIRTLFAEQAFYQSEDLWNIFADVPRLAAVDLLSDIIDNKNFQVSHDGLNGYIRYCNGYYIFQPNVYADLSIPLAVRVAKFPIKRDLYAPLEYEMPEMVEEDETATSFTGSIEGFWTAITDWIAYLSTASKYKIPPGEVQQRIIEVSHDDAEALDKYRQILEMVEWFHTSFQKSSNKNTEAFREALSFYFWDEWLTLEEQKFLVYSSDINVLDCIRDNQFQLGKLLVNRFLNPKNGELEFMCEGGTGCVKSIIDEIRRTKTEPIQAFKVNTKTTGNPYGFIVPKNGDVVFKTGEPPEEAGKLGRGKECGNVSTMTGHIANLVQIGDILKGAGKSDFDLNRTALLSTRKIKNSTRACTLLDILIRFLDANSVNDRRWFFRPVQSLYTGHKGLFRPGKK